MTEADWVTGEGKAITVFLNGLGIAESDPLGEDIVDDSFLLLFNAAPRTVTFTLPGKEYGEIWQIVVDTADPLLATAARRSRNIRPGGRLRQTERSILVLRSQLIAAPPESPPVPELLGQ